MPNRQSMAGFTLIELLIVVAIIAILAAIAVPNFLEAQTRAKVSRVKADLRTLHTGVETYKIDNTRYPMHMLVNQTGNTEYADPWPGTSAWTYNEFHFSRIYSITTPLAYITNQPPDPFYRQGVPVNPGSTIAATGRREARRQFQYANSNDRADPKTPNGPATIAAAKAIYGEFVTWSGGPDGFRRDIFLRSPSTDAMRIYDGTNGTISVGDIWRTQMNPDGSRPTVAGKVD